MKNLIWKIYFWSLLVIYVIFHCWLGFSKPWEILDALHSAVAFAGLFGFTWKVKVFRPLFWKIFFILTLVWLPWGALHPKVKGMNFSAVDHMVGLILFLPFLYALYRYGFRRGRSI